MALDKQVPEDQYFHVDGGPTLPTLLALRAHLRVMPREQFARHVGGGRNDFAEWAHYVFGERALAEQMRKCSTKEQMLSLLDEAFNARRSVERNTSSSSAVAAGAALAEPPSPGGSVRGPADRPASLSQEIETVVEKTPVLASVRIDSGDRDPSAVDGENRTGDWPDDRFSPIRREMAERNEKLGEKYDGIIKRFQGAFEDPMPKEIEEWAEKLSSRYNDLLVRISEERRAGHDMFFPALQAKQFPAKLTLAKATRAKSDFAIASLVLDQTERMIGEVIAAEGMTVKRQVLAMAGMLDEDGAQASGGAR